ncbi:nucleoside hydrolase [Conexibacter woesei]|uniref:nucleoside hydrolase n=1 Tax=Conexibacter woesei TaxID=191495 RepID=UPI00041F7B65|nr:nucleoside hydrolase [Conexibacter woesei]
MTAPAPIILDCDPGHDDMVAILLAAGSPAIDLRAITTVSGNGGLDAVTRNALLTCTHAGIRDVPVAAGCAVPLVQPRQIAQDVHGESAMDGADLGEPDVPLDPRHAVDLMADILNNSADPISLVPTGPLTNVALLLRRHPELQPKIKDIVLMGGAVRGGNRQPLAEFNIWADPEAADIVFTSGLDVTMCPLDVTHQALATAEVLSEIEALGTPLARLVVALLGFFADRYNRLWGFPAAPVHDPVAVARIIDPQVVGVVDANVQIELTGTWTRGATVVDHHGYTGRPANARVALELDHAGFWALVTEAIGRLGKARENRP